MFEIQNKNIYLKNTLSLAYLGDSVFSLKVRAYLVEKYDFKANILNKMANKVVCAPAQAEFMAKLKQNLNDEELDVANRARNSHSNNKAKNSTLSEYNLATQFEAVLGFWFLTEQYNKIEKVFNDYVLEKL